MKKALLLLIVLQALVLTSKAQLGYGYAQYSMGFGFAYNSPKTDVPYPVYNPAVNLNASFNLTPYTRFSIEYEFGQLAAGYSYFYSDAAKKLDASSKTYATDLAAIPIAYAAAYDPYYRYYNNHYQSIAVHADIQLGEIMDYDNGSLLNRVIRNIYVGTGIGMVYNSINNNNRYNTDTTYVYGGTDHSNNVMIPVRVGYQLKLYNAYDEPFILLEAGYQMNYVFGYGLDGYSDPLFTSRNFERYGGFNVGIKFNFGNVISYRKAIH